MIGDRVSPNPLTRTFLLFLCVVFYACYPFSFDTVTIGYRKLTYDYDHLTPILPCDEPCFIVGVVKRLVGGLDLGDVVEGIEGVGLVCGVGVSYFGLDADFWIVRHGLL